MAPIEMTLTRPARRGRKCAWSIRLCAKCGADFQAALGLNASFCSIECETTHDSIEWTEASRRRLRELITARAPIDGIAAELGMSIAAITKGAQDFGYIAPRLRALPGPRNGASQRSRTYRIWSALVARATSIRGKRQQDYFGRGIDCDPRWTQSFDNFLADMGECPDGLSIERLDNNKGYWPNNCCWATYSEQQRNKRLRKPVVFDGQTTNFKAAATKLGAASEKLRYYARYYGDSEQRLLDAVVEVGGAENFFALYKPGARLFNKPGRPRKSSQLSVTEITAP